MKILHLNAGNETGGGMYHILRMLNKFNENQAVSCILGVMEKKELYRRAVKAGIKTVHFENNTRFSMPLLQKILRYIEEENVTHIHTHGPRANVYMNMLQKRITVPWVVTIHSDPFFDFKDKGWYGKLLTKLHIQAVKNADRIISVSRTFQSPLVEAGIRESNIKTVHNGIEFQEEISDEFVPVRQESFREELGFLEEDFLFLKVARLEAVKGHCMALRAVAELVGKKEKNVHLLLVGDGSLRKKLTDLAKELNISRHVHFFGEQRDIDRFYEIADVTLLTSLSESFPYVLLESARAKKPIIATDVGDIDSLLYKEELGWKVNTSDVDGLVEAMTEAVYLEEKGLHQMGNRLFSYASSNFSLDKCANEVYNVYRSV